MGEYTHTHTHTHTHTLTDTHTHSHSHLFIFILQITSGEYIQMSGRAGRRGIDDRGIVMLMVDEQMDSVVGKNLLRVSG